MDIVKRSGEMQELDVEKLSLEYAQIRVLSAPFAIATIPVIGLSLNILNESK